ncbi:uncharacterized protein LOC120431927 [Culex pipiens pallens]|uniref:uncharacterized protein LOC120431927 n=1 Tax=Culex pipiens pallens TaxID=42434 RepID=UPI001953E807|nr:uncharacterized protein LOC120431927 [Culex pipiens pallens]
MERFSDVVHQRELAQGKLVTILDSLKDATMLTWAALKTCQKEVEAAYDAYHTAYGKNLGMVPSTSRDEQDALYDAFDDLHTEVLTVIEEKLLEVSQPTRRRNAYTPGVPQRVDETTNQTTAKIVGCANETAIDEPPKRSGKLLGKQLDTEDRVRPEFTIPHGERSENNHKIEKLKTIIDTCKIADERDSSQPTKKPPGQNATDDPGQQKMVSTAGSEPAQKCDVCGLGQHKSWKCPQFLEMAVPQRLIKVKEKQLCFNCLRAGHTSAQCVSNGACATCKKRHHTLLQAEYRRNPKQPTTQTKVEQPGAPQQAESDQVTPEASSSGQLAPDALSAVADSQNKPCSPHPCRGLLIAASKTHLTKDILDKHNANELAGVEEMQPRSTTSATPAEFQLAVRVNLVGLREMRFSQVMDGTTGRGAAREEAVRAQATALRTNIEEHDGGPPYKEASEVSDPTNANKDYLSFHAVARTPKTTLAFLAERFLLEGTRLEVTRCSILLQSNALWLVEQMTERTRAASAPYKAAAVSLQLMIGERSKYPPAAAPTNKRQKSGTRGIHPYERSVYADPLKRVSPDGTEESPWRSRTRCRFSAIGKHQQSLEYIPQVGQAFWRPLRLSTALTGTFCKNATKLSLVLDNRAKWVRIDLRIPRAPGEEVKEDLPGQRTAKRGRRKSDLWIAWRSTAVHRGWRMFEPEPFSSKKILLCFDSTAVASISVAAMLATMPTPL